MVVAITASASGYYHAQYEIFINFDVPLLSNLSDPRSTERQDLQILD
jgi:hypothetical protein